MVCIIYLVKFCDIQRIKTWHVDISCKKNLTSNLSGPRHSCIAINDKEMLIKVTGSHTLFEITDIRKYAGHGIAVSSDSSGGFKR